MKTSNDSIALLIIPLTMLSSFNGWIRSSREFISGPDWGRSKNTAKRRRFSGGQNIAPPLKGGHDPDLTQIFELDHGFDARHDAGFAQAGEDLSCRIFDIGCVKSRCAEKIQFRNRRLRINLITLGEDDFPRRRPVSRKYL